jgi:hypothetical protein
MKENAKGEYIAPEIDVIMIQTEQGFAQSGGAQGWGKDGEQSW